MTEYCRAEQRAALSSILELLIGVDVTSYFIACFQRIVKFLKASGKRWIYLFVLFCCCCFFKSVYAKVLTR